MVTYFGENFTLTRSDGLSCILIQPQKFEKLANKTLSFNNQSHAHTDNKSISHRKILFNHLNLAGKENRLKSNNLEDDNDNDDDKNCHFPHSLIVCNVNTRENLF